MFFILLPSLCKYMLKPQLYNKLNRSTAEKELEKENFDRLVLSFYRYVKIENTQNLRDFLFEEWGKLKVLGRVYLANEGINAQVSIPEPQLELFKAIINSLDLFKGIEFKFGAKKSKVSFYKLTIKVKEQIVADGLRENTFDLKNIGKKLSAKEWNSKMENGAVVVDMRNHYESEVGHFKGAILPQSVTFKQELPMVVDLLKGKENESVLLYCTGGIRCEKASAFLKHKGFKDVCQLNGGIINYAKSVEKNKLENKFKGVNFVFDDRLGERITDDVISKCHQCGDSCDKHTNCANLQCNLLFIQCDKCSKSNQKCCSPECIDVIKLPETTQKKLRAKKKNRLIFHSHKKADLSLKFKR